MRRTRPGNLSPGDLIVVIDAHGKADDLPRFRVANGIEGNAEFGHVSGVGEIGLGIPVSILSKGGIARLLVATSIVGGDDKLPPRINDLGNPCGVALFKIAVVSINEDFHTVIFPGRSIFRIRIGIVIDYPVVGHFHRNIKVVLEHTGIHVELDIGVIPDLIGRAISKTTPSQ